MSERMDTCASCRFWKYQEGIGDGYGACRRHAPKLIDLSVTRPHQVELGRQPAYESAWPMMAGEQWCGDYEAKRG